MFSHIFRLKLFLIYWFNWHTNVSTRVDQNNTFFCLLMTKQINWHSDKSWDNCQLLNSSSIDFYINFNFQTEFLRVWTCKLVCFTVCMVDTLDLLITKLTMTKKEKNISNSVLSWKGRFFFFWCGLSGVKLANICQQFQTFFHVESKNSPTSRNPAKIKIDTYFYNHNFTNIHT